MIRITSKSQLLRISDEAIKRFFEDTVFEGVFSHEVKSKKYADSCKGSISDIKMNGEPTDILGSYVNVPANAPSIQEGPCTFKCRVNEGNIRISPTQLSTYLCTWTLKALRIRNQGTTDNRSFIRNLQKQKCAYGNAGLVRTQAESLKQLSAGIYTEEERFVYELLQNAVDAYIDTSNNLLDVHIDIKGDMLCFMHNGAPFSERDIEGLCDVGRSNKASDEKQSNKKKVGYKGIGFKSVFMQSVDYVCVKSGDYCFKFDKAACLQIMPKFPGETLVADDIPWQIVPIECKCPDLFDISNYNVATFIRNTSNGTLVGKIRSLLENPQFLLFLNANNIRITLTYNDTKLISSSRQSTNGEVRLLCNDVITSRWLVHTSDPIAVNDNVRKFLVRDFNTPQKLKEAKTFEISFAIAINSKGEIEAIKDSVVYTFLPTSYKNLGTPFLVNANFITDAGRQQLHQNSEWNKLIFSAIPECYLKWISTLSPLYREYYKVLPGISPKSQDDLTSLYSSCLKKALNTVPFIPRLKDNKVIKVADAIIDKYSFGKAVGNDLLIKYVNSKEGKNYNDEAFISDNAISLMKSYGVHVFDKDSMMSFLSNDTLLSGITIDRDKDLLNYLHDFCHNEKIESSEIENLLPHTKIIIDDNNELNKAEDLFFPAIDNDLDESDNKLSFINSELYNSLSAEIKAWLGPEGLGIRELSKASVVEHILSHPESINPDNALEIGRFLYSAWKKENFLDYSDNSSKIKALPFLTKKQDVVPLCNLYLSSNYRPEDDLEPVFEDIDYISTDYVKEGEWEDWSFFLKKCGIRHKIGISSTILSARSDEGKMYLNKYGFLSDAVDSFRDKKHHYTGYCGFKNPIININLTLNYFSYINPDEPNFDLYKLVFSKELVQPYNAQNYQDRLKGSINYWGSKVDDALTEHTPNEFSIRYKSFLEYVVSNEQRFPNVMGGLELACDTFLNTTTILQYGGHYLPILDISSTINDSWLRILPFKKEMQLEDYLTVLSRISESTAKPEKELISSIYQRLVELEYQSNPLIREWGKNNKLLSVSNDSFLPVNQLSYITVEGFSNESQAYIGKVERSLWEGVVELLETFGVRVITRDKIKPIFDNQDKSEELNDLLLKKLDTITLLKGGIKSKETFDKERSIIKDKITDSEFYRCQTIQLSYGNESDVITKNTYAIGNKFYYTGSLKPTRIGPLVSALSKHLDLKNVNEELLMVLITNNIDDLLDYLKDKGYPIEYVERPASINTGINSNGSADSEYSNGPYDTVGYDEESFGDNSEHSSRKTADDSNSKERKEQFIAEYSEKVKEFMGSDFSMPSDRIKSEHIIARFRALMYIMKLGGEYTIKDTFNEKEYIRTDGYAPIPLENGKQINIQSAKYGIWHLSPVIWKDIVNNGNYACLCTGNGEYDFKMVTSENDIKEIAENTRNVFMRMTPSATMDIMDTIKSVMTPDILKLGDGILLETVYTDRDVHLMLMVHHTPEPALNSIFDHVFKAEGTFELD